MNEKFLYVFPTKNGNVISFELSETDTRPPPGSQAPPVKLSRNSGRCKFTITIKDTNQPKLGVTFASNPMDACEGTSCPTEKGITTDQIIELETNATQITFVNRNKGRERSLYYRLNFDVDGEAHDLDPEIKNGGGTGNLYAALLGLGAVTALAYIAYLAFYK